jgi:hypothetical protein
MAALLEAEIGVRVNVVNATGGQGVTGHSRGARARPDGYTLTMMTVELNMLHWRGLTTVTPGSFAPLVLFNRDPAAVFVRADAPWRTLAELERFVRSLARPARGRPRLDLAPRPGGGTPPGEDPPGPLAASQERPGDGRAAGRTVDVAARPRRRSRYRPDRCAALA